MRKIYGYARVSTKEQNLDRQILALQKFGIDDRDIIRDKASGKTLDREGYKMVRNHLLREGDSLVIMSLDRLSRNKVHIRQELEYYRQKKIRVMILDMPTTLTEVPDGQTEGSASISFVDGVNQLAVAIRIRKGYLEMIMTEELDKAQDITSAYLEPAAKIWTIRDPALRDFMKKIAENPPAINYAVGAEYDWQGPVEFNKGKFNLKLYLIEDWIYEEVKNSTNSGIRCRPKDVEDGWIYFSFWLNGFSIEEEDRYHAEGQWNGFTTKTSYPASVKSITGIDTRHAIWSYEVVNTDTGDFAIINDDADGWFQEYEDQISDTLTILTFTTN